ncbi:DUF2726 domain-containing protein [Bacillus sp. DE0042]|uniref:DUF2726 domain-containing protein n=1 Tax=Bacillus sp. DE0042 TaxID=2584950 RepID=UPI0021B64AF9|nr:DUF2726 domain-containing protein [Bacillus sp. DE0042]
MRRISHEEFIDRVKTVQGDSFEIIGKYVNRRTKIEVKHKCGFVYYTLPETLTNGYGCPKCSGNLKKTTAFFKKEVFELVGSEYEVLGDYTTTHGKIEFKHNICGHIFPMMAKAFVIQNQRCPNCKKKLLSKKFKKTNADFKKEVLDIVGDEYEPLEVYQGKGEKIKFIHHKCGNKFKMRPNQFLSHNCRCPFCYHSKGEDTIFKYLKEKGIKFKTQFKIKECKNKRPLPFDFAIFNVDSNEIICLIEFDGKQHFEPVFGLETFKKTKINDSIKNQFCKHKGILLIRIPYTVNNIEHELDKLFSRYA